MLEIIEPADLQFELDDEINQENEKRNKLLKIKNEQQKEIFWRIKGNQATLWISLNAISNLVLQI